MTAVPPLLAGLARLRGSLLIAAALVAAGGGVLILARSQHEQAEFTHRRSADALARIEARLISASEANTRALETLRQVATLRASGITEEPDRIGWLETLRTFRTERHLDHLDYELRAQRALDSVAGETNTPFLASALHLTGSLAHEGHLLDLLQHLRNQRDALLLPRHCRLIRKGPDSPYEPGARLDVDCELDMVTLQLESPLAKPP